VNKEPVAKSAGDNYQTHLKSLQDEKGERSQKESGILNGEETDEK